MNHDLIERYIYAVTKRMPKKLRGDVSAELHTLISDMLEERCGEVVPTEKDIKVVLTELGTPNELSSQYDNDNKKCLIGEPYYHTYKQVLKIVLLCTIFGMSVAGIISQISEPSQAWYVGVFQAVGALFGGLLFAFAFITLLFAFFYHKDIPIDISSDLNELPPVPKQNEVISKTESIIGIIIAIIFSIVFLTVPQIFGMYSSEYGGWIPFFNIQAIKETWYFIILFSLIGVVRDTVKLIDRRYTQRVVITTVISNICSAVLTVFWLLRSGMVNPNLIAAAENIFQKDKFIVDIIANFQNVLLGVIIFALVLDSLETVIKTIKQSGLQLKKELT